MTVDENKVVTTANLSTFKAQMETVMDKKLESAGAANITYATEQDILDLFKTNDGENV